MWSLLKSAVDGFFRHKTARLGAALAYYSVFSLGPLLLIVTAIAGFFFGADAVRGSLTSQFRSLLGDTGSQAVEAMLKGAESATGGGLAAIFGVSLLIVAALGVVVQLRDALNTIFETKEPDDAGLAWYARVYALSFAGILALGFLLAVFGMDQRLRGAKRAAIRDQLCDLAGCGDAFVFDALQVASGPATVMAGGGRWRLCDRAAVQHRQDRDRLVHRHAGT